MIEVPGILQSSQSEFFKRRMLPH
uniref:Uncharacterized protein n=1 Tax=Anguilla anguilla TaxID=7936 RepID=A0A0E9V3U0_ANGAN